MFLYLDPRFPFCRRLKNVFQQGWMCTASASWDLGLGKCHTSWCISTLLLLIPYQMKAVGVRHACWPLTSTVKKQHLNKRQISLSLELHCKQLWRTPPDLWEAPSHSAVTHHHPCLKGHDVMGKMAANVISIMQRINVGPSPDPCTHQREPSRHTGWCSVWGATQRSWQVGGHAAGGVMWRGQNNNASHPHGNTRLRLWHGAVQTRALKGRQNARPRIGRSNASSWFQGHLLQTADKCSGCQAVSDRTSWLNYCTGKKEEVTPERSQRI